MAAIADLDLDRTARRGYPEAVYAEGKTIEQLQVIAAEIARSGTRVLFTRLDQTKADALRRVLPDLGWDHSAHLAWHPSAFPAPTGAKVVVACAGTSDLPVAREAWLTARFLGRDADLVVDVGVAGLHRVLGHLDSLRAAGAIVVAAGMDGALPSVIAGLVACPVIALPTSVGYGAAFAGLAPLLAMLNACSPGVAVVNIDNGYGAGYLAAQITAA